MGADPTVLTPSRTGVPGPTRVCASPSRCLRGGQKPPGPAFTAVGAPLCCSTQGPWPRAGAHPVAGGGFGGDDPIPITVTAGLCQHRPVATVLHVGFPCQPLACLAGGGGRARRGSGSSQPRCWE